jgi:hypothetical protein
MAGCASPWSAGASLFGASGHDVTPRPVREVMVHGFRAPVTGIELRHEHLGFFVGVYPIILADEDVTTWFSKVGVSAYVGRFRTGPRDSNFYGAISLLQGLSGDHDVRVSLDDGTAFSVETGFRWAIGPALDLRLGAIALVTAAGQVSVNPTPGISWTVPLP